MAEVKITADSGGGSVALKGPASTTGNAAVSLKLPVADGSAGQVLQTDGSGNLSWVTPAQSGVTHATIWRQTGTQSISSGSWTDVTGNWEQSDQTFSGSLGTAVSQSSGIFTFPQTGIWRVDGQWTWIEDGTLSYGICELKVTTDNGSNWATSGKSFGAITNASDTLYTSHNFQTLLDVTDTSNTKVKISLYVSHNIQYNGSSDNDVTNVIFTRLGDT